MAQLRTDLLALEREAIETYHVPELLLMEQAAVGLFRVIDQLLKGDKQTKLVFLAGRGNNGGDALACARLCQIAGYQDIRVLSTGQPSSPTALTYWQLLHAQGIPVVDASDPTQQQATLYTADCVVDGLLGLGLNRVIDGLEAQLIEAVNQARHRIGYSVIAVDLPSGVDAATGTLWGATIQADQTVTFTTSKPGLHVQPGKQMAGDVTVQSVGLPDNLLYPEADIHLLSPPFSLPLRAADAYKQQLGHTLVIGGSAQYPGAAVLAANAASRSGVGLVTLASGEPVLRHPQVVADCIQYPLPFNEFTSLGEPAVRSLLDHLKEHPDRYQSIVLGPGLGLASETIEALQQLIVYLRGAYNGRVILDADALNGLGLLMDRHADDVGPLFPLGHRFVLTPHPGEAARLFPDLAEGDPLSVAKTLRDRLGCHVIYKTAVNILAPYAESGCHISDVGHSGMATAGTGDVLSGLLGGLLAQALQPLDAMKAGVLLHGLSGEASAELYGTESMTASSLIEAIPDAFDRLAVC